MNRQQARYYLAAMIDGEGTVQFRSTQTRWVAVANTEQDIIDAITEACDVLGLNYAVMQKRRAKEHHAVCWDVILRGRETMEKVLAEVPLRCTRKREKLAAMLASYRPARPTADQLRVLYIEWGMSTYRIGEKLGFSPRAVGNWLRAADIPLRTASEAAQNRPSVGVCALISHSGRF